MVINVALWLWFMWTLFSCLMWFMTWLDERDVIQKCEDLRHENMVLEGKLSSKDCSISRLALLNKFIEAKNKELLEASRNNNRQLIDYKSYVNDLELVFKRGLGNRRSKNEQQQQK
jgi:uncharacterized membrane protein YqhA